MMTKKDVKIFLTQVDDVLQMDYHEFLKFYNDNIMPVCQVETDYYNVFRAQRLYCIGVIKNVVRGLG